MSRLIRALRADAEAFIPSRAEKKKAKPAFRAPRRLAACLCSLVLVATAVTAVLLSARGAAPSYANCYFSVDINPSVEFTTGEDGRVEQVSPKNKFAITLLEGRQFSGMEPEAVLGEILGLAEASGYFDRTQRDNAVLINVLAEDERSTGKIESRMREGALDFFKREYIFGVVLTSTSSQKSNPTAAELNITPAKLELIEEILRFDRTGLTAEALAGMPVKELNAMLKEIKSKGFIVFDDDFIEDLNDEYEELKEEAEEALEELEDFVKDLKHREEDAEEGEEDEGEEENDFGEANESIQLLNGLFQKNWPLWGSTTDCKGELEAIEREVKEILKEKKGRVDAEVEQYRAELEAQAEEIRSKGELADEQFNLGKDEYIKEFEDEYEDWLEDQLEDWEENWETRREAWYGKLFSGS